LSLQLIEEPNGPGDIGTAIEDITQERHMALSTNPLPFRINESGVPQKTENPFVFSVHVPHHIKRVDSGKDVGGSIRRLVQVDHRGVENILG
jgi:hypothetical protein